MNPKLGVLLAGLVTAITAYLQKRGLHVTSTAIVGAVSGLLTSAHAIAHPPVRRKLKKVLPTRWRGKAGLGLWVWNATDPKGHVNKCRSHGYGWLALKVHEGTHEYNDPAIIDEYRRLCAKYKIKFGAWGYCSSPTYEGGIVAAKLAHDFGARFYIADVEAEFERAPRAASRHFIQGFEHTAKETGYHPTSLWLSSFGRVDLHPDIDYREWARAGWGFMPQAYSCESAELQPGACLRHAEDYWPRHLIQPTLGAYAGARGRIPADQLAHEAKGLGLKGVNVWEAHTATPQELARVAGVV